MSNEVKLFEDSPVRSQWSESNEKRYFSVVDVIAILTDQATRDSARKYWSVMKTRMKKEGAQPTTICSQLKMKAYDGRMRLTDVADTEQLLRIIQSVPSHKAEPFKIWLAKVGYERIQEMADPSTAIDRARTIYKKLGRSEKWIQQRMSGHETRNKLTDYWADHEVEGSKEFAILTNIIHKEWTGLSVKEHKGLKSLKTENLRDHMSEAELIFTALAELSTRQIAEVEQSKGMQENSISAKRGGKIAKQAREKLELEIRQKVVTGENFLPPGREPKQIKGRK